MKKVLQTMVLICVGCGGHKVSPSGTIIKAPCFITLGYESMSFTGGLMTPRYVAKGYSESCQPYLGANLQTLRYRLTVEAPESVGRMEEIAIDGRRISLANFALTKQNFVVDDIDTSSIDNGPLQMQEIWLTFAFPESSEIGLYPSKVELVITTKN